MRTPIPYSTMISNKLAIGSLSLGQHASHMLDDKIRIAAKHGLRGIEVVYADLERYAASRGLSMLAGAEAIRRLCGDSGVEIVSLAPFENFEGHPSPLEPRLATAARWLDVACALGAPYLQVPAAYDEACSRDEGVIAAELRALADLAAARRPAVAIAYEPMSWSVAVPTWQAALRVIRAVGRDNFGLCLDSFHILTRLWASPFAADGRFPRADEVLAASLADFRRDFPLDRLFYVQLSDAERFDPPFSEAHPWYTEGEAAEFTWSRHGRPYPGEAEFGAYLPVGDFLKACVADTGFKGWVSMEIFDRRMRAPSHTIETAAQRATKSWAKLLDEIREPKGKL